MLKIFISSILIVLFYVKLIHSQSENCGIIAPSVRNYIFGGKSSLIEQWPWQLHLKITNKHVKNFEDYDHANCGGTILDDSWIVTAAHCFSDHHEPNIFILNGHNTTLNDNYKLIKYDEIIKHPNYREYTGNHEFSTNDIALVKISNSYRFLKSLPRPCLPKQNSIIPANSICYITGFGASDRFDTQPVKRLKEGKVAIKYDKICIKSLSLPYYDNDTMICAGRAKGSKANSCQGDSGGPLVCEGSFGDSKQERWYLFGITSFGALDCTSFSSSVYTKVSSYVDWINETIRRKRSYKRSIFGH
ncbi:unnamed protein product [Brachionus calyciflorus]|uniref:Peptidase S1 domain-containing protein n=1 Tax=Brachionus calyciflorus TaxID=104777 RepID=A0A813UZF9_9BILA|nr:unnamed protein product [Brachionus calyciflorus]